MGLLHLRNTRFFNDVETVAVTEKSKKHLDKSRFYGITKTSTDYKDLLKQNDLKAVVISLPTYMLKVLF